MAINIPDKLDFNVKPDTSGDHIMINRSTQEENTMVLDEHILKARLIDQKRQISSSTTMVAEFHIPLSSMNRTSRQTYQQKHIRV